MTKAQAGPELLTPAEVGAMFKVSAKTVTRWAQLGRFPDGSVIRPTPRGHRRYVAEVMRHLVTDWRVS